MNFAFSAYPFFALGQTPGATFACDKRLGEAACSGEVYTGARRKRMAALAGAAALLIGMLAGSHRVYAATPTLTPGTYNVSAMFTSLTQLTPGSYCVPAVQNNFYSSLIYWFFTITYKGAGIAAEATFPVPANPTATPGPFVALLSLPPTPTGSRIQWSGKYLQKLLPVGGNFTRQTFTATLIATSRHSFLGKMSLKAFSDGPGNSCDIDFQYAAVFVGPLE
jgi:hypothetical protein